MRNRYLLTATTAFVVVIITGGVWIGAASRIVPGRPGHLITVLGAVFSAAFVWLLIARLRSFLARPERRAIELGLLALNFAILVLSFAWVHSEIGLMDLSGGVPRPTRDFGDALYFSIVTSTTLGYGDFIPLGSGRPVAAIQALVGYFILGILVSAGYQIIAPGVDPTPDEEPESERRGSPTGRSGAGGPGAEGGA